MKKIVLFLFAVILFVSIKLVQGADSTQLSQVINAGTLDVGIVDTNGDPVASPAVAFAAKTFSFDYQTSTATLGAASEKIRVSNPTTTATWSLTIAATSGITTVWTDGGSNTYDFNDSTALAVDGADTDSVGGQLSIDPTAGTIALISPYTTTGVSKGSSSAFEEGVTNSITVLSADGTANAPGRWDYTGASLSQTLPGGQANASYTLDMTLTAA